MKLGLVLPSIPSYSETFFRNKIIGLQQHGVEVVLFINNPRETFSLCKVYNAPELNGTTLLRYWNSLKALFKSVILYPKRSLKFYQLEKEDNRPFNQIIKNLIANQFIMSKELDWLHFGFGTMALGRENIAAVMGANMAVSFRGFDIAIYPIKYPNCYKMLFKKADKIHVISDDIMQLLYKQGLNRSKEIVKITPAIETAFFKPVSHIPNGTIQLTTIARLHWKKGLEYTLEALAILKAENLPFHYTIIGDGVEKERLQFAVYQLGLSDCVTFRGKLPPEEVKSQLQHTDVYIQYSIQEGFCNAVLEAQAMGLLCIVSDAEGLSENILDTKTGWVVPKRQPKLLAQKIREVCQLGVPEKERIRQAALKRVQEDFNLEKQQQAFLAFYEIK
jgi:glycosyltransferase involved in cell wall biosynthesis